MTNSEAQPLAAVPPIARSEVGADLAAVYAESYRSLVGFAFRLTGDAGLAEDVVHEAFVRLASRWVGVSKPVPFLYRTVGNLANDAWRRAARDERLAGSVGAPEPAAPYDPAVRDAVRRLPRAERTVVTLYYFADLAVTDVAAITRKAPGTVKWLLASARDRLARDLGDPDA